MIITQAELMALPTSGVPYTFMKTQADSVFPGVNLCNQDNKNAACTLAAALMYARTGQTSYKDKVITQLTVVKNTTGATMSNDPNCRSLSVGRQVAGYVISADLIGYRDPAFVSWVDWIRDFYIGHHGRWTTVEETAKNSCANWGAWCMASLTACALYLGDTAELSKMNDLMNAILLGDRAAYKRAITPIPTNAPPEAQWLDYFQKTNAWDETYCHDPVNWWAVNPASAGEKSGCIVEDMARSEGPYPKFDETGSQYSWETMGGWMLTARLLYHAGYTDIYARGDKALLRCAQFLKNVAGGYPPPYSGMNVPLTQVNKVYGVNYGPLYGDGTGLGRMWAYTDWLSAL